MAELYNNAGELFDPERLEQVKDYPEWKSERIEDVRVALEELYEKRQTQLEEGLSEMESRYFWTSYVLRAFGTVYSVAEMTPETTPSDDFRPDFTLFYSPEEFRNALPYRSDREFFVNALAVMRGLTWDASMDEIETEEGIYNPALDVDRAIRATGVDWGILTNGRLWRLYHRESSGLMDTYFEMDLIAALESNETEAFKYFWMVFSPEGLGGAGNVEPIVHRLLK